MKISNQAVAIYAMTGAIVTTFGAFVLSRGDANLKLMSLQAVLTLGGSLIGISGTLLVGISAYNSIMAGAQHGDTPPPPGSLLTNTVQEKIQLPPAPDPPLAQ